MKTIIPFLIGVSIFAQCNKKQAQTAYVANLMQHRLGKNEKFKLAEESPLASESERKLFSGLEYFEPDTQYRLTAKFKIISSPDTVYFATTTDRKPMYIQYAQVFFSIQGKSYSLYAYTSPEVSQIAGMEKYLFIPFSDATNGKETYGGGRYLDAEIPEGESMVLDFNYAYNPYCHYNHSYSCPKIPEANRLNIEIRAGEKKLY